jgi:hypothetical protein
VTNCETATTKFLEATQWSNAQRVTAAGDASSRRYDRLTHCDVGHPEGIAQAEEMMNV